LTFNALAAASMLPERANARKYFRSSQSNIGAVCNFATSFGNLAAALALAHWDIFSANMTMINGQC
jgi:hypothetical protein